MKTLMITVPDGCGLNCHDCCLYCDGLKDTAKEAVDVLVDGQGRLGTPLVRGKYYTFDGQPVQLFAVKKEEGR